MTTEQKGEWVTLEVADGTKMRAYVAHPGEKKNGRGILVFQEAFGVNHYIRGIAERFAKEGYLAIAPELFHRTGDGIEVAYTDYEGTKEPMGALTDEGLANDVKAAFAWLVSQNVSDVVTIGFCMGGRTSYLADMTIPISAAVSFYGGGIAQTLVDRTSELKAPILLIWGGKDTHITKEHRDAITTALTANGKKFENLVMSEGDHGFFCDERAAYNPQAAAEAWPLVLAFLNTHKPGVNVC